jgi:uncharacterized protein (TIGR03067 family)
MNVAEHPTAHQLTAFGLGKLDEAASATIEAHLAECETCRQALDSPPADSLIALARTAQESGAEMHIRGLPTAHGARTCAYATATSTEIPEELRNHPRYRIQELLGVGGMGAVFKAEHLIMQRVVALKVINRRLVANPAMVDRFRREAQAAARLNHPNIVHAHDADQAGDAHFLVMEHVDGMSLARLIADNGPLPIERACDYIRQAACGLAHAHERGMVHRDIKPQNLMVTADDQVKILDFGLARLALENAPPLSTVCGAAGAVTTGAIGEMPSDALTQVGVVMGTPDYIAPEQARDAHAADIRADIYSLGCTLYDLLTGRPPFHDGTVLQKVIGHLERRPTPICEMRPELPAALARIIDKMMAKDPAQRYQSPAQVAEALAPWCRGIARPAARPRRRVRVAIAGFLVVLAGIVGVSFLPPVQDLAQTVIRIATNKGVLEIVADDEDLDITVKQAGKIAVTELVSKQTKKVYELTAVDGEIEVHEKGAAGSGVKSKTPFQLTRGGRVVLTAKMLLANVVVPAVDSGPVWVQLFNGKDLTGWKNNQERWDVKKGVLIADRGGEMVSKRAVTSDFRLRTELKLKRGTGVIRFRAPATGENEWSFALMEGREGTVDVAIHSRQRKPGQIVRDLPNILDEWIVLEIAGSGQEATVRINGKLVAHIQDDNYQAAPGHIAFWIGAAVDPETTEMHVRKIELMELPPRPAPASAWVPLFNGKDLTGWKSHPGQPGDWRVEQGMLVGHAKKASHLFSERGDYENFHLRVEAKITGGGDSGVVFRSDYGFNPKNQQHLGYEANISFSNEFNTGSLWGADWPPVGPKDNPIGPDTWFTMEVIAIGNHIVIKVDGKTTVDFVDVNSRFRRGHLALQAWALKTVVYFRKIEIKELPKTAAKSDEELLQGKWICGSAEHDQGKVPAHGVAAVWFEFKGKTVKARFVGPWTEFATGDDFVAEGRYTLDDAKNPKQIVMSFDKDSGLPLRGIYKIDGDDLDLCLDRAGKVKDFKAYGASTLTYSFWLRHEETFVPLFNGKDLAGWQSWVPEAWIAKGDVLTNAGTDNSALWTEKTFANYVLRFDFQLLKSLIGEPAAMMVGIHDSPKKPPIYWIRVAETGACSIRPSNGAQGTAVEAQVEGIKLNQWNTMKVRCQGSDLEVVLNCKCIGKITGCSPASGQIVLHSPALRGNPVSYRNVQIRLLPPLTAPPEPAFQPLFNGKDLTGWHVSDTHPGLWKVADGILNGRLRDDKRWLRTVLVSDRNDLCNFHARIEMKLNGGTTGVAIQAAPPSYTTNEMFLRFDDRPPAQSMGVTVRRRGGDKAIRYFDVDTAKLRDQWFTVEIIARDPEITYLLNGKEVALVNDVRFESGHLSLDVALPGSVLSVRKIEIKELPPIRPAPAPAAPP